MESKFRIKKIGKITDGEIIFFFVIISLLLQNISVFSNYFFGFVGCFFGFSLLLYDFFYYKFNFLLFFFLFFVILTYSLNIICFHNISASFIIKFLLEYFPIAIYLLNVKNISKNISWLLFCFIVILIEWFWYRSPDNYLLFENLSRNYISIYLLFAIFLLLVIYDKKDKDLPYWILILNLVLCIFAIGRSGIISSILLFVLFTFHKARNSFLKKYKIEIPICIGLSFILFIVFNNNFILASFFPRFQDEGAIVSNNGRLRIYSKYLQLMFSSLKNFVFGVKISDMNSYIPFINGNLHCSYLQIHASFGIMGLILLGIGLFNSLKYLYKREKYQHIIFLLTYLLRIMFDFCVCGFLGDIIIVYYILYPPIYKIYEKRKIFA